MENNSLTKQNQTKDVMLSKIWVNLTMTERNVIENTKDKKISDSTESEVMTLLKYIFAFVGLKDYPFEEEFLILSKATKRLLFNFTSKEITYAFDLAIKGTIQYDLNLYDKSFSIVYLSGLMNEYEKYRASVNAKYKKLLEEIETQEKAPSQEEIKLLNYKAAKEGCIDLFSKIKSGKDVSLSDVDFVGARYEFMKSLNLFEIDGEIIDDFKKLAISKVEKELMKESINERKRGVFDSIKKTETQQEKITRYTHNHEILYYFKLVCSTGRELSEIIELAEKNK
jgi:hypothetical protein